MDLYNPKTIEKFKTMQCKYCGTYLESAASCRRHRIAMHPGERAPNNQEPTELEIIQDTLKAAVGIVDQRDDLYLVVFQDDAEWLPAPPNHHLVLEYKSERASLLEGTNDMLPSIEDIAEFLAPPFIPIDN